METLIGILLYIGAITTNVTYTTQEIYQIEDDNQEQVDAVSQDPQQMQEVSNLLETVTIKYLDGGDKVVVVEDVVF